MDRKMIIAAAALWALTAVCAWGGWEYAGQWGEFGNWPQHFRFPFGVATSSNGTVYISDPGQERIKYFTPSGSLLGYWGEPGYGAGQFYWVLGIAIGPNGYIYTVEERTYRVQYFTSTGEFRGMWGSEGTGNGQFMQPHYIAAGPNGNIYIADYGTSEVKYFTSNGSYLGKWGSWGGGPGEFGFLWGIECAPNGNVYVLDVSHQRVQYFTPTGSYLGMWGVNIPNHQLHAGDIEVSPDGTVFTLLGGLPGIPSGHVAHFTAAGSLLSTFGDSGAGPGQFGELDGFATNNAGTLFYVTDPDNCRVQYFRRNEPKIEPTSLGRVKAIYR